MASASSRGSRARVEELAFDESTAESEQMFEMADPNGGKADDIDPLGEEQIKVEPDLYDDYGASTADPMEEDAEFVITEIDDPSAYAAYANGESSHFQAQSPRYTCGHCGKEFIYLKSYQQHRLVHALRTDMVECQICHKELKRSAMDYHMKYKHSEERNFLCALCHSRFKSPGALRHHVATFHPYKGVECEECERIFKTLDHLKKHKEIAHRVKKVVLEKFICEYCKKEFPNQGQLTLHIGIIGKKLGKCRDTL